MRHPNSEELLWHYYERDGTLAEHLTACSNCRDEFKRLEHLLNEVRESEVPEPAAGYETRLWAGIKKELPSRSVPRRIWAWGASCAAAAALLLIFVQPPLPKVETPGVTRVDGNRVVHGALSEYLGQTQILLTEISNDASADEERVRARELVEDGRLLRAVLRQRGDEKRAAVLEELEPMLLTLANGPEKMTPGDWRELQLRVRDSGLVFKVAVVQSNLTKGNPL